MALPVCILVGLIISACTKLNAVILGQPVSVSGLDLIALAVVLALIAGILWLVRAIIRDGLRLRIQPATGGPG